MLFRVVLITLVLGTTVALNLASPEKLGDRRALYLFAIVGGTYVLTLVYAVSLRLGRVLRLVPFANIQISLDLAMTTLLVHATGSAESLYSWFYSLSIIGAAMVRGRRGAFVIAAVSALLFTAVAMLTRWGILVRMGGGSVSGVELIRLLFVNTGAFGAVAILSAQLATELRRADERVLAQRRVAETLAAQSADIIRCLTSGLVTVDRDGRITTWNQAATDILGISLTDALQEPLRDILPPVAPLLDQLAGGVEVRRAEVDTTNRSDGSPRALGISISQLTDDRGSEVGYIVNFQDLTQLRQMGAAVKRAERLAVVGRLTASIAHEIRNPLAAISGSVELLERGPTPEQAPDPETRTLMQIVKREVDRMNGLVTQLVEYARPRTMVATSLDLDLVVRETVRVFAQDRSFPGVQPLAEGPEQRIMVNGDPEQLRQVVWNLLRNGAEAMAEGGKLRVSVEQVGGTEPLARLRVADSGVGIPADDLERIFDPFFTTKQRGTGLGLATVQRIVEEHKGSLSVESKLGEGTTFTVALPLAAEA